MRVLKIGVRINAKRVLGDCIAVVVGRRPDNLHRCAAREARDARSEDWSGRRIGACGRLRAHVERVRSSAERVGRPHTEAVPAAGLDERGGRRDVGRADAPSGH